MARIGEIIRVLRIKRGYSQSQLADMLGLKRSAIGNYEQGIREPDLDTVEALADLFDVSVADLMGRNEREYRDDKSGNMNEYLNKEDDELMRELEAIRRDPERRKLFKRASYSDIDEVRQANAILDALKETKQ